MKSDALDLNARLKIERLGARGEGVARVSRGLVFVPYALAGETILAEVDGERGKLVELIEASPDRVAPFCRYYGECGGCAVQTLRSPAYLAWKRSIVLDAMRNAAVEAPVQDIVDAHGAGRRRVVFHARSAFRGPRVGFMRARAHEIVEIDCIHEFQDVHQNVLQVSFQKLFCLRMSKQHRQAFSSCNLNWQTL